MRELTVSKLYQSFTLSGTITSSEDNNNNSNSNKSNEFIKRKSIDYKDLAQRKV